MKSHILLLALVGSAASASGQLGFGNPKTVNPQPNSINYCEEDPDGFFEINWKAAGNVASGALEVVLPPGASYVAGSREDRNAVPADVTSTVGRAGDTLRFGLRDLRAGDSGTIRYKLSYDCRVDEAFAEPFELPVRAVSGGTAFEIRTSPINNSGSKPLLRPEATPATAIAEAEPGQTFARGFDVAQTGQRAEAYSFVLCVSYGGGLSAVDQELEGEPVAFPSANGGCVVVDEAAYPGLPWPFGQGDRWRFTETVTVDRCDAIASTAETRFGCQGSCQENARLSLPIRLADNAPRVRAVRIDRELNPETCMAEGALVEAEFEVTGKAYGARFRLLGAGFNTYVDPASIEVDLGAGAYEAYSGGLQATSSPNGSCDPANRRDYVLDPLEIPIDATGAPTLIRARYRVLWCCEATAESRFDAEGVYGARVEAFVEDKCGVQVSDIASVNAYSVGVNGSAEVPAAIADGETADWVYRFDYFTLSTILRANANVCVDLDLPAGLSVAGGARARFQNYYGGNLHVADVTAQGGGRYRACFPEGALNGAGATVRVPVTYACSPAAAGTEAVSSARLSIDLGSDAACAAPDECDLNLFVADAVTALGDDCVASACDGLRHLGAAVTRASLGAPDKDRDGCDDGDGVYDERLLRRDRAMEGDRVVVASEALVTLASPGDELGFVTVDLAWAEAHALAGEGAVEIVDASAAGATYACDAVGVAATGTLTSRVRLVASALAGCGTVPAGFRFADGDTVRLRVPYEVAGNVGCDIADVAVTPEWYADRGAAPGVDRLQCNGPIPANYRQVGYEHLNEQWQYRSHGCAGVYYEFRSTFCVGGGITGSIAWPGEVRDFGKPVTLDMEVPPGMTFDSLQLRYLRTTRAPGSPVVYGGVDVTAETRVRGDRVELDWAAVAPPCDPEVAFMPGEGHRYAARAYFSGGCRAEASSPTGLVAHRFTYPAGSSYADEVRVDTIAYRSAVRPAVPELSLESVTAEATPAADRAEWTFSLRERRGAAAPNAWVALVNPSGRIVPAGLSRGGLAVEPTDGIYRLGDLGPSSIAELTLSAAFGGCGEDSLTVLSGWECGGYPASLADVLAGGIPCEPGELTLRMSPEEPGVQLAIVEQPAARAEACSDQAYELELVNTSGAELYEPVFELFVPYDGGVAIVPGSGRAAYPSPRDPAPGDFGVALGAPTESIITPAGTKYLWDLDALVDGFDAESGLGWPGLDAADPDARRISVRFEVRTECGFIIGDYLNFRVTGRSYCGTRIASVLRNGREIRFTGVATPYEAAMTLAQPDTLEGCADGGAVTLDGSVAFFDETDGEDFLLLALPPALRYESIVTPDASVFDLGGAVVTEIESADGAVAFDEVRIPVAAGLERFRRVDFAIRARVDPDGILCDDPSTLRLRAVRSVAYGCRGDTCAGLIETGTIPTDNGGFAIATDTFAVAAPVRLTASCDFATVALDYAAVRNGRSGDMSSPLTLDVYRDVDGSRDVGPGDALVLSYALDGAIAAGATRDYAAEAIALGEVLDGCALVAELRGCGCAAAPAPAVALAVENAGDDVAEAICSGRDAALGCGPAAPGYAYRWYPADAGAAGTLADASAPETTLTYVNDTRADVTVAYVLESTAPAGCVTVDTVAVTYGPDCASIGDYVFVDADADGLQSAADMPLPDVTVTLHDAASGDALATELTSPTGRYYFDDFPAGRYYVAFDASTSDLGAAYVFTEQGTAPGAGDDSNADADGRTPAFDFDPALGLVDDVDAGVIPVGEIAAVRYAESFVNEDDGTVTAVIVTGVRNVGRADLTGLSLVDPLAADFGASFRGVVTAVASGVGPAAAGSFDGAADAEMLSGDDAYVLAAGDEFALRSRVRFDPREAAFPILTQATVTARVALGGRAAGGDAMAVTDLSDSGRDFAGANPGEPGDTGTADDPLAIACVDAAAEILGADDATCGGAGVTLRAGSAVADATYTWLRPGTDDVLATGPEYAFAPGDGGGAVALFVGADGCAYGLGAEATVEGGRIPTLLTPDGDGLNDRFRIPCLEARPGSAIAVYNRWGDAVFEADDYRGDWDGTFGGKDLPEGTYFYILTLAGPDAETLNGYVYLKR